MLTRARSALRAVTRGRRAPQSLVEFASRLELDAAGMRDQSQTLSPARLAVAVEDLSQACDHLAAAADAWSCWLGCDARTLFAVGSAEGAVGALEHLRALRADLGQTRDAARALSVSLTELARHDRRSGATS